ncbi:MAG: transglutaminase domain-containing protein, partial [Planctomycetota bacterium]|nr:transglutaminase domain-containing protein [Planctomycetota bacterium]
YNSSSFPTAREQVRRGILRLRLGRSIAVKSISNLHSPRPKISFEKKRRHNGSIPESNPSDSFTLFPTAKHLPNSGREVSSGAYSRAPAFGLASMEFGSTEYLWATSYNKYLYLAHAPDGRGLFHFDSPGKKKIYGLACGDGVLWAVDRISGPDQIHRIRITENLDTPHQWNRKVRHIQVTKSSTSKNDRDHAGLTQNLGLVHPRTKRPGQNYDPFSLSRSSHPCASITIENYDPAGDSSSRQLVVQSRYDGTISAGETITSTYDVDVVTSNFRQYLYPHLCDTSGSTEPGYLDDCSTIYRMSDAAAYAEFLDRIEEAMNEEYGSSALSSNPYWRARNILEFITEHYEYGNVGDPDAGHYAYHPSNLKMELLWDATSGNEKMSCSTSAFTLVGLCRSLGIPARWVGTSRFRNRYEDASGTEVSYDTNGDTFLGVGESSKDKPFHRWAEVWMGDFYGWQRFDPTPKSDGPRELSQYELMWKATKGVVDTDLVLSIGSGREEPFFNNRRNMQYYNAGANYDHPDDWSTDTKYVTWSNACFVEITSVSVTGAGLHTLSWNLTGRWDLDSSATLILRIQPMVADGTSWIRDGSSTTLQTGLAAVSGSATVDLSGFDAGTYRIEVVKTSDSRTGAASSILTLP